MEHTLLMLTFSAAIIVTVVSFIVKDHIFLRWLSAFLLIFFSLSLFLPTMFVGFTSTGVSTYISSAAGDPGRAEEVYFAWGLGFFGFGQILYTLWLMLIAARSPMEGRFQSAEAVRRYN